MESDTNTAKPDQTVAQKPSPGTSRRRKIRDRRQTVRRSLIRSRLTRNIFISNLIGLLILISGSLAMNRFESGLIEAKLNNLQTTAETITTVLGNTATGYELAAELDIENAKQVLRSLEPSDRERIRLHDKTGILIADSETLDDTIEVGTLDPISTEEVKDPVLESSWKRFDNWLESKVHNLPWRVRKRERLRRDLKFDVKQALEGTPMRGQRYEGDDGLVVTVSLPVKRVQQVLGVVTVESSDVDNIVNAERKALAPFIGLAILATILSSAALTLFVASPMRRLAQAAQIVTRSSRKRDAIPDLSHRRDEIGDLSIVMREMTQGLYSRIDDIANFAADVAHEIKNPLTSLRSASDTLRVAKTDEQREKLISIIQQDVSRMDRLITDISKASKVDASLARETAEIVSLAEIIANITEFYEEPRAGDGPRVLNCVKSDLDNIIYIRAFETPFAQVLRNLIDNALTFSEIDGEVRIDLALHHLNPDRVILTVDDDGPGIPPDNLETIFERFYTQRPAGAQFGSHSGLGLAICRQIIQAHKGRIYADNRIDADTGSVKGARFTVELPRHFEASASSGSRRKRKGDGQSDNTDP